MKRQNCMKRIKDRINSSDPDAIFVSSEFYDITEPVKVSLCLKRLADGGLLERIRRGMFVKPGCAPLNAEKIARAVARGNGWNIVPCGDTALYVSGLSDKVPDEWTFVSEGPYKAYAINGFSIKFKHTDNKNEIADVSYESALTIQALRALGKNKVSLNHIYMLAERLPLNEKSKLANGTTKVTAWIKKDLIKICNRAEEIMTYVPSPNKPFRQESKKIATFYGFNVRSKSEALIVSSLHMAGLDFIYEKQIFDRYGNPYRPDFTITYKGKTFFWEHIGMQELTTYKKDWADKQIMYERDYPRMLITTVEDFDVCEQIRRLILDTFSINIVPQAG